MAKRTSEPRNRYFQVHYYMVITEAWRALSAPARAVYIQMGSRYSGSNNGRSTRSPSVRRRPNATSRQTRPPVCSRS